jgi:NitT/TauT family transport system substrate-binding protein
MKARHIQLVAAALVCASLGLGGPASAQAPKVAPTKVTVSLMYLTNDIGVFLGIERGYFAEQNLDLDLQRMTSAGEAIALLATNKLDVGSGGVTPGLFNAFRQGMPIQIVTEKGTVLPPGENGSGRILVRRDLVESGAVKDIANLKGLRIAVNSLQSPSLNYVMRALEKGGLGKNDVTWVEMPFPQFAPAFEKKAIDAGMVFNPFQGAIVDKLKLAVPLAGTGLETTSEGDALNVMFYSPGFAKTDAAKRFMVAHLKAQRDYQRIIDGNGDIKEVCRAVNKYIPSMPADCTGLSFTGVRTDGEVKLDSLERYQKEWLEWGVMKEPVDIQKHVNEDFAKYAVSVLGPYKK